jgi:hypothetical protein
MHDIPSDARDPCRLRSFKDAPGPPGIPSTGLGCSCPVGSLLPMCSSGCAVDSLDAPPRPHQPHNHRFSSRFYLHHKIQQNSHPYAVSWSHESNPHSFWHVFTSSIISTKHAAHSLGLPESITRALRCDSGEPFAVPLFPQRPQSRSSVLLG